MFVRKSKYDALKAHSENAWDLHQTARAALSKALMDVNERDRTIARMTSTANSLNATIAELRSQLVAVRKAASEKPADLDARDALLLEAEDLIDND